MQVDKPVEVDGQEAQLALEDARKGRPWADCTAGFYYVKPNYPGRSSHASRAEQTRVELADLRAEL